MRACPYCHRPNCVYAWQTPGTPPPPGVPLIDASSGAGMIAGPAMNGSGFGALTAKDWIGGITACLQGAIGGAAAGAAIGAAGAGVMAIPGAIIGGIVGCAAGVGAYALAQFVQAEQEKKQEEFAQQQSAAFQQQIAVQKQQLEKGLEGTVGGVPTWVIPAALAIVGLGFLARKKKAA